MVIPYHLEDYPKGMAMCGLYSPVPVCMIDDTFRHQMEFSIYNNVNKLYLLHDESLLVSDSHFKWVIEEYNKDGTINLGNKASFNQELRLSYARQ